MHIMMEEMSYLDCLNLRKAGQKLRGNIQLLILQILKLLEEEVQQKRIISKLLVKDLLLLHFIVLGFHSVFAEPKATEQVAFLLKEAQRSKRFRSLKFKFRGQNIHPA